jgi:hypothetical protein
MPTNTWMNHVKNFRNRNSKLSYREVLRQARKSYGGGIVGDTRSLVAKYATAVGGADTIPISPTKNVPSSFKSTKGGKRRKSLKTRRRRR